MVGQATAYVALAAAIVATSGGFLFDDCPAPVPPCTCGPNGIDCASKQLTSMPVFRNTSMRMTRTWGLDLIKNDISSIHDNAFLKLFTISNGRNITLYLSYNNLTDASFGSNAFGGIAAMITHLHLDSNKLTSIPTAVGKLTHLATLHIRSNPLASIDPQIMISLRHTLSMLDISLSRMSSWPESFRHLNVLGHLTVHAYKHIIPHDAFTGLQTSLIYLIFDNSAFRDLPVAVCRLERLRMLEIYSNGNLTNGIDVQCRSPLTSVTSLNLEHDNMKQFPSVFALFPNLHLLNIDGSDISYIDGERIPPNTTLDFLQLVSSKVTSVPLAINTFALLQLCDLRNNHIMTLEPGTFHDLIHLARIDLNDNPIVFISHSAFRNLPALTTLDLQRTKLTIIPQAVKTLPRLSLLDMTGTPIVCNCDSHWIRAWVGRVGRQNVTIRGTCETSHETISQFFNGTIPICP